MGLFFVQGVRAGDDRLGFVGLVGKVGEQLAGQYTFEISFDVDIVDDIECAGSAWNKAVAAAVGVAVDRDGSLTIGQQKYLTTTQGSLNPIARHRRNR